jgi:hypothetical protein
MRDHAERCTMLDVIAVLFKKPMIRQNTRECRFWVSLTSQFRKVDHIRRVSINANMHRI